MPLSDKLDLEGYVGKMAARALRAWGRGRAKRLPRMFGFATYSNLTVGTSTCSSSRSLQVDGSMLRAGTKVDNGRARTNDGAVSFACQGPADLKG